MFDCRVVFLCTSDPGGLRLWVLASRLFGTAPIGGLLDCAPSLRKLALCSPPAADTQCQAEERHIILCGGVPELLQLLQEHLRRQPQQKQEWEEQHQQQRLRQQQQQQQQQHGLLRPPQQPPPLLHKQLRRPPSEFVPQQPAPP